MPFKILSVIVWFSKNSFLPAKKHRKVYIGHLGLIWKRKAWELPRQLEAALGAPPNAFMPYVAVLRKGIARASGAPGPRAASRRPSSISRMIEASRPGRSGQCFLGVAHRRWRWRCRGARLAAGNPCVEPWRSICRAALRASRRRSFSANRKTRRNRFRNSAL